MVRRYLLQASRVYNTKLSYSSPTVLRHPDESIPSPQILDPLMERVKQRRAETLWFYNEGALSDSSDSSNDDDDEDYEDCDEHRPAAATIPRLWLAHNTTREPAIVGGRHAPMNAVYSERGASQYGMCIVVDCRQDCK